MGIPNEALSLQNPEELLRQLQLEKSRRPQSLPQRLFLTTDADIAIFGGAAGAGKTYGMLLAPLPHISNPRFSSVIFRRETPQIRNPGGLWDESIPMYAPFKVNSVSGPLEHRFPSGAMVKFAHLERDETVYDWDGAQIPMIGFDQLEHFSFKQFFYMLSRNRSACGVRPTIKATCNPNADCWLAEFISWWIDQSTGYPIKERGGVLRWFVREGDAVIWAASREELISRDPDALPMSVTFIPGNVYDNKKLLEVNPQYLANLKSLSLVERERLLGGNWKIRPAAGLMFRREWCEVVDALPADAQFVRYWDRAGTEKTVDNDPDLTVGIKMARSHSTGAFYLVDARWGHMSAGKVDDAIKNTASADGKKCHVGIPQDPGQAGKGQAQATVKMLPNYRVSYKIESGDKVTRFGPFSSQCEAGNVKILRGFDDEVLRRLEAFPDGRYKDDADACSGAYDMLTNRQGAAIFDFMRQEAEAAQNG